MCVDNDKDAQITSPSNRNRPKPELSCVNFDESWSCFPLKRIEVTSPLAVLTVTHLGQSRMTETPTRSRTGSDKTCTGIDDQGRSRSGNPEGSKHDGETSEQREEEQLEHLRNR